MFNFCMLWIPAEVTCYIYLWTRDLGWSLLIWPLSKNLFTQMHTEHTVQLHFWWRYAALVDISWVFLSDEVLWSLYLGKSAPSQVRLMAAVPWGITLTRNVCMPDSKHRIIKVYSSRHTGHHIIWPSWESREAIVI